MTIAMISKGWLNPAHAYARSAAELVALSLGYVVRHYVPEEADNSVQQCSLLRQAIEDGVQAILIAPIDCPEFLPEVQHAQDLGIPVAYFISKPDRAETYVASVGADDQALGRILTSAIGEAVGNGKVILMEGYAAAPTNRDRKTGVLQAMRDYENIQITHCLCGRYQREPAFKAMAEFLKEGGRADAVIAFNDVMALGALDALEKAGKRMLIVGVNAIQEVLAKIKEGRIFATVGFDPGPMAAAAMTALVHHLEGRPHLKDINLPLSLVTANNIDQFLLARQDNGLPPDVPTNASNITST